MRYNAQGACDRNIFQFSKRPEHCQQGVACEELFNFGATHDSRGTFCKFEEPQCIYSYTSRGQWLFGGKFGDVTRSWGSRDFYFCVLDFGHGCGTLNLK
ncbi:hypothetical protein AG1IA_03547 [Rhizoctonia solani AG-1 IA]|uniref:Uncharacterized protein n=1 Tax=Thanatephorus cucumeris (strain AG1-IA) TaxID=983506 RepID=L8WWF5_THACA|nr:hypothetical protein AG1IA_03547 [Rhizoctonia solani AG-1 IA]